MKSKLMLLLIAVVYLFSFKSYNNYGGFLRGGGDCWGYYAYLPATFIYHDLDNLQQTIKKRASYNPNSVQPQPDGYLQIEEAHAYGKNTIIKYTCGIAILNFPFFLVAHLFCSTTQLYAADGYTLPYNLLIGVATLFYSLLGFWFLRKMLLKYFSNTITTVTLFAIAIGTNIYFFSVWNLGMSHTYLFALYAIGLYATDCFYQTNKIRYALLIGFCCGFITLIRPNEIIFCLFPLLWNVVSFDELKNRFHFIFKHIHFYLLMLLVFVLINLTQIIYWKTLSDKFIFYSYTKEGFDFLHPHIKDGLFGFENGWLTYTPIMLFAVIGLFFLPNYFKKSALATYLFLPLYIYIIYSWWCWQYINGFGSRPMVETYAILAFPLASFSVYIWKNKIIKSIFLLLIAFFSFVNLFQTWQFNKGLIWTEDANFAFYKAIFLKTKSNYNALVAYDSKETQPDTSNLNYKKKIGFQDFEDSVSTDYIARIARNGQHSFELHNGTTPVISLKATESAILPLDYIKVSAWVYCEALQHNHYKQAVLAVSFKHDGEQIRWRILRLQTKIGNTDFSIWHSGNLNQWQYVYFFVRVPHRFKTNKDELNVLAWNPSDVPIIIDDIQVEHWQKK